MSSPARIGLLASDSEDRETLPDAEVPSTLPFSQQMDGVDAGVHPPPPSSHSGSYMQWLRVGERKLSFTPCCVSCLPCQGGVPAAPRHGRTMSKLEEVLKRLQYGEEQGTRYVEG